MSSSQNADFLTTKYVAKGSIIKSGKICDIETCPDQSVNFFIHINSDDRQVRHERLCCLHSAELTESLEKSEIMIWNVYFIFPTALSVSPSPETRLYVLCSEMTCNHRVVAGFSFYDHNATFLGRLLVCPCHAKKVVESANVCKISVARSYKHFLETECMHLSMTEDGDLNCSHPCNTESCQEPASKMFTLRSGQDQRSLYFCSAHAEYFRLRLDAGYCASEAQQNSRATMSSVSEKRIT